MGVAMRVASCFLAQIGAALFQSRVHPLALWRTNLCECCDLVACLDAAHCPGAKISGLNRPCRRLAKRQEDPQACYSRAVRPRLTQFDAVGCMLVHVSLTHVALLLFQAGKLPFQCDRGTEAACGSTQVLLGTLQPFRAAGPHRRCGGRNGLECEQKLDAANRKGRKLTCFVGRHSSQEKHTRERSHNSLHPCARSYLGIRGRGMQFLPWSSCGGEMSSVRGCLS